MQACLQMGKDNKKRSEAVSFLLTLPLNGIGAVNDRIKNKSPGNPGPYFWLKQLSRALPG